MNYALFAVALLTGIWALCVLGNLLRAAFTSARYGSGWGAALDMLIFALAGTASFAFFNAAVSA